MFQTSRPYHTNVNLAARCVTASEGFGAVLRYPDPEPKHVRSVSWPVRNFSEMAIGMTCILGHAGHSLIPIKL